MLVSVCRDVGDELLSCQRQQTLSLFNEKCGWNECEHATGLARREGLQANIFTFEADALQVVIGNFVWNLEAG